MKELIERLYSILDTELSFHRELLAAARQMNAGVREERADQVQAATALHDRHVMEIEQLEEQRLAICDEIAGDNSRHRPLLSIIESFPDNDKKRFLALRESLKGVIDELSRVNMSNRILLQEGLDDISKRFGIISRAQEKFAPYRREGTMDTKNVNRIMFNRIA